MHSFSKCKEKKLGKISIFLSKCLEIAQGNAKL